MTTLAIEPSPASTASKSRRLALSGDDILLASHSVKISEADILIAPGLGNSGPEHWQRRWGARMANARFIEQDNWDSPVVADWVARIHREIMLATRPVVLIGHSLSVAAIVLTAQRLVDTKGAGRVSRLAARF